MFGSSAPAKAASPGKELTTASEAPRRTAIPRCDIRETATSVFVTADMPGVTSDGVEVAVHGDTLILKGRNAAKEAPGFQLLWREYASRDYERSFRLGQDIDPEQVGATIKDGVLRIELHKRAAATPKRIAVTAG